VIAQDEGAAQKAIVAYIAARGGEGAEMYLYQVVNENQSEAAQWTIEACHPNSPLILAQGLPGGAEWQEPARGLLSHAEKFVDRPQIRRPGQPEESRPVIYREAIR